MKKEKDELDLMEKPKGRKGLVFALILTILIILGLVGYILYDKGIIKLDNKATKTEEKAKKDEVKELDVNSEEVKELVKKYNLLSVNIMSGGNIYRITDNKKTVKDFSSEDYAVIIENSDYEVGKQGLCPDGSDDDCTVITVDEYNNIFKDLFGQDIEPVKYTGDGGYCGLFSYNDKANNYFRTYRCGGAGAHGEAFTYKATKDDKEIKISTKPHVFTLLEEENKESLDTLDGKTITTGAYETIDATKYADYLDTYEFTFRKASDGKYYFYSIENLNDAKEYTE